MFGLDDGEAAAHFSVLRRSTATALAVGKAKACKQF